jgi:hypothetical protein
MTGTAWVIAAALALVFVGACVAAWLDDRRWRREFEADTYREPPSRLDRADWGDDPWRP